MRAQDLGLVQGEIPSPQEREAALQRAQPASLERMAPKTLKVPAHDFHHPEAKALRRLREQVRLASTTQSKSEKESRQIPGSYIVSFKKGAFPYSHRARGGEVDFIDPSGTSLSATAKGIVDLLGGDLVYVYAVGDGAFCALLSDEQAKELSTLPHIERVEPDSLAFPAAYVDSDRWGLDRLDQRAPLLNSDCSFGNNGTTPVHLYIIDSGILGSHTEFTGRFSTSYTVTGEPANQDFVDYDGAGPNTTTGPHGTLVAGAAAGATTGVARDATIHSVRITDSNGWSSASYIAAGIQVVRNSRQTPAVANLSWGGPTSALVTDAITSLVDSGVQLVLAAGNSATGVNGFTWHHSAIVVGATDRSDSRAWFSNYGRVVDIWAPGEGLYLPSGTGYETASGTSFAAPFVAGIAALYLSSHPSASSAAVESAIKANSTRGIVAGFPDLDLPPGNLAYAKASWLNLDTLVVDGSGAVTNLNVQHPNGNVYDQVMLTGTSVTVTSDPNQITRVSWIDENDDIVQAEFTGPGSLKIALENPSGPALPVKYNQSAAYMKGRAKFEFYAATATTYFSVFSVGTANAVNQSIFIPGMQYDGVADVKSLLVFQSREMAGILMGNAVFRGDSDTVGIDASGTIPNFPTQALIEHTSIRNKLVIRDIKAGNSAVAQFLIGVSPMVDSSFSGYPIVAGGNLVQNHGGKIMYRDISHLGESAMPFIGLVTNPSTNSHGVWTAPQALNSARLAIYVQGEPVNALPYQTVNYSPAMSGNTAAN